MEGKPEKRQRHHRLSPAQMGLHPHHSEGKAMTNCDDNGPVVMCVTNVQTDPEEGTIATGRLFSGKLKTGGKVFLVNAQAEGVVNQVSIYMGSFKESVGDIAAGNIAA